jgi:hypothetical protein
LTVTALRTLLRLAVSRCQRHGYADFEFLKLFADKRMDAARESLLQLQIGFKLLRVGWKKVILVKHLNDPRVDEIL